jgi:hypothetical protein
MIGKSANTSGSRVQFKEYELLGTGTKAGRTPSEHANGMKDDKVLRAHRRSRWNSLNLLYIRNMIMYVPASQTVSKPPPLGYQYVYQAPPNAICASVQMLIPFPQLTALLPVDCTSSWERLAVARA